MTQINGYINHSDFRDSVSTTCCDCNFSESIIIYIPDEFKVSKSTSGTPLIKMECDMLENPWYSLNDIINITRDGRIFISDMRYPFDDNVIYLKYDNLGWGNQHELD